MNIPALPSQGDSLLGGWGLNPRTKRPEDLMRVELLYALKIKYEVT
jgi:hypothetical protein